jgi:hypothetical protein
MLGVQQLPLQFIDGFFMTGDLVVLVADLLDLFLEHFSFFLGRQFPAPFFALQARVLPLLQALEFLLFLFQLGFELACLLFFCF